MQPGYFDRSNLLAKFTDQIHRSTEAMHRRKLEAREKMRGREDPDTLTSVSNLGLVPDSQGKYEEAEWMHRRAPG